MLHLSTKTTMLMLLKITLLMQEMSMLTTQLMLLSMMTTQLMLLMKTMLKLLVTTSVPAEILRHV